MILSNASPIQLKYVLSYKNLDYVGVSRGWKLGIIPTKVGRGIIGNNDLG